MMILSDWRIILRNGRRILLLTCQRTITSLNFPIGVIYWENQIHLWAIIFGSQNFPVWHMFLKCRSRANENESQRTERGFFSQQTNIQNPLPFCTHLFLFEGYRSIFEKHISRNLCLFQPPHKFEFEIGEQVIRSIFWGSETACKGYKAYPFYRLKGSTLETLLDFVLKLLIFILSNTSFFCHYLFRFPSSYLVYTCTWMLYSCYSRLSNAW